MLEHSALRGGGTHRVAARALCLFQRLLKASFVPDTSHPAGRPSGMGFSCCLCVSVPSGWTRCRAQEDILSVLPSLPRRRLRAPQWRKPSAELPEHRRLRPISTGGPSSLPMAVGKCPSGANVLGRWPGAARLARKWSAGISSSSSNTSNLFSNDGTQCALMV